MYQSQKDGCIIRLSDNAIIPNDTRNKDWIKYQQWLQEGNIPIPLQPSLYHTLNNNNEWVEDLKLWLDTKVRPERDRRLVTCDYLMMPDYPIDADRKAAWETYRTQLRDLPTTLTTVADPIPWPLVPAQ